MESEDEVDVEGDFDLCARSNLENDFNDFNEPPSKVALLQPEISQHPWTLEQGWSLDQCTDERSRAAIEKMLLEEQSYLEGNEVLKENTESSFQFVTEPKPWTGKGNRRLWTEEEKTMFEKGVEIFGKKWSKIAELIPTRTSEQVKHYGYSYFRKFETVGEKVDSTSSKGHFAKSLKEMLTTVTTGQPTVTTLPRKKFSKFNSVVKQTGKVLSMPETSQVIAEKFPESEVVRLQKQIDDESEEVNIEDEEETCCGDDLTESLHIVTETDTTKPFLSLGKCNSWLGDTHNSSEISHIGETCVSSISNQVLTPYRQAGEKCTDELLSNENIVNFALNDSDHILDINNEIVYENEAELEVNSNPPCETISSSERSIGPIDSSIGSTTSLFMANIETNEIPEVNHQGQVNKVDITDIMEGENEIVKRTDNCFEQEESIEDKVDELFASHSAMESAVTEEISSESVVCSNQSDRLGKLEGDVENTEDSLSEEDDLSQDFAIQGSDGKVFTLPNPVVEKLIDHEHISEEEKEIFVEFFDGRPGLKDAEKYCRIRNYILDMWEESKPSFLYKTNVRGGLKKCGDVNILGRIHAYLEQIGAINFGCDQVQYRVKKKPRKRKPVTPVGVQLAKYRKEALQQRRRKVRDMFGSWVDEKEREGTTIDHTKIPKDKKTPLQHRSKQVKHQYDPFKLIPCQEFTTSVPAPFKVHIDLTSLIVLDLHAHLSKTEVIGLLGGQYNSKKKVLEILLTEPCDSLSTGMQCEMDPEAKERIASQNMQVVGWYHSHPTFEPSPSVRDIETQECLQEWFAAGKCPFIGVIINPYSSLHNSMHSTVRSLIISRHTNKCANMGLPFQFDNHVVSKQAISVVLDTCKKLLEKYSQYQNRVDMLTSFRPGSTVTCLDKLVMSININVKEMQQLNDDDIISRKLELEHFVWTLRNMVEKSFVVS